MKKYKLIYLIPIIILSSCQSGKQNVINDGIFSTVTGKILDYDKYPNTKFVTLKRELWGLKESNLEGKVNEDGSFKIRFKQIASEVFYLKPFSDLHLFISPGDSINLKIDLSKGTIFEGDSKEYNKALNEFYREGYFGEEFSEDIQTISNLSAEEYIKYRENIAKNELSSLEKFKKDKSPPVSLEQNLEAHIINKKHTLLLKYGISNCSFLNEPKPKEIEIEESYKYFAEVKEELVKDIPNTINHSSANELLNWYSLYFFQKFLNINIKEIINRSDRNFLVINGIIENEENEIIKENLLYRHAKFMLESNELKEYKLFSKQLNTHIKSEKLRQELNNKFQILVKNGLEINPMEDYNIKEDKSLNAIIAEHNGKVIFIDFWATWCKPCIIDIIESKELIESTYKNKEIEFVYICTGTDKETCNQLLKENNIKGIQLFLDNKDSQRIMSNFNNSALPFQILVNKKGEVVRKGNDLRLYLPSTNNLIEELLRK